MRHLPILAALLAPLMLAVPAEAQFAQLARPSRPRVLATTTLRQRPPVRVRRTVRWDALRRARITSPVEIAPPTPAPAPRGPGRVQCAVTENGAYGPALIEVRREGRVIASGSCASPLTVPAGDYHATLTLESAIDRPQQTVPLRVPEDGVGVARAEFSTAIVEVRFQKNGAPVYGQAVLMRDGRVLGSIGGGIPARVSAGSLTIDARYRTDRRTYELVLAPGQRRALQVRF